MSTNEQHVKLQVQYFLRVWSYWEKTLKAGISNLPSGTALAIAKVKPDFLTRQYGSKQPYINELADRMNFIINNQLAKENPNQAEALRIIYLNDFEEIEKIAKEKKITWRGIYKRSTAAKKWLCHKVQNDAFFYEYLY